MSGIRGVVWLDRDGTLVDDPGYLKDPAAVRLLRGAAAAVARLNRAGATVVLVTNQSGIGRGLLDRTDFAAVQAELVRQLDEQGAHLDDVRFCPHAPANSGDARCRCRKPAPGMVEDARRALGIGASTPEVAVGDKAADLDLGRSCGAGRVLVLTGEGTATRDALAAEGTLDSRADHVAADLAAAVPWILGQLGLADGAGTC